ncbi:UPF0235 protein C15orf40 [Hibiscus syriacus]|uniref:UPF0235 protein C15orf40 n=1 Tax=Hibiscus syriacus TaxID=106335 RepID=A0A6A3ASJ4_HIBSY|nr:UPF0235 protein C15orf40 [Hibiscus syriacus]
MALLSALLLLFSSLCVQQSSCIIPLGASLSSATQTTSWTSPSRRFAFGFYNRGNGLYVGVWLDGNGKKANKVIWTAKRDDRPFTSDATLKLNEIGVIVSTAECREMIFIANENHSDAYSASMLDSGNFVIYNKDNHIIWESFQHPTDTILGGQSLLANSQLISSLSENDPSAGMYHLRRQNDGNLVLYPLESEDSPTTAYWKAETYVTNVANLSLRLNSTGVLQLINNIDSSVYRTIHLSNQEESYSDFNESRSNNSKSIVYSASLDVDGNFRLYAHVFEPNGGFQTYAMRSALVNSCKIKGFCGFNSYCTFNDNRPFCACLPGTDFIDPNQNTIGCKRNYSEAHCKGGKANIPLYNITSMQGIEWTTGYILQ